MSLRRQHAKSIVAVLALRMEAVGLHPSHSAAVNYKGRTLLFLGGESNHGKSMGLIEAGVRTVGLEERNRLGQGRGPGVGEGVYDDRPSLGYRSLSTSSRRTWGVAARMKKNGRSQKRFTKSARFARRTSLSTIGMTWPGASSSLVRK